MRHKVYLGLALFVIAVCVFIWWDVRTSRDSIRQNIRRERTAADLLPKRAKPASRREMTPEEYANSSKSAQPATTSPNAWKDLKKRFPNMQIEKSEEVHFTDGTVERWSLFRTTSENDKLWIVKETHGTFEAAAAGEILLQIKGDAQLKEFEATARDAGFEFEMEDADLGIYAVRFDPEDMALYREALSRLSDLARQGSSVQPNRMVGIWGNDYGLGR